MFLLDDLLVPIHVSRHVGSARERGANDGYGNLVRRQRVYLA